MKKLKSGYIPVICLLIYFVEITHPIFILKKRDNYILNIDYIGCELNIGIERILM